VPPTKLRPSSLLPNPFYSCALSLCKKYRFTCDQLCKGQAKSLYNVLVTSNMNTTKNTSLIQKPIDETFTTNYLKTFKYRCVWDNLLVFKKYPHFSLDPAIACTYFKIHLESLVHLLLECQHVQPIWTYISNVIQRFPGSLLIPIYSLCFALTVPLQLVQFTEDISLLITATRHKNGKPEIKYILTMKSSNLITSWCP